MIPVFETKNLRWRDLGTTETGARMHMPAGDNDQWLSPPVLLVEGSSGRCTVSAGARGGSRYEVEDKEAVFADPTFWIRLVAADAMRRESRTPDGGHPAGAWYIDHLNPRYLHIHTGTKDARYDLIVHFDRKDWVVFRSDRGAITIVARGADDDWHELYLKPEQIRDMEKMAAQL